MKKVGFFGGSFDPIHFGHITLAIEMLEEHHLDEILFCPAYCSPFKQEMPPHSAAHHRLEMLRLSLDHPQFRLTSIELERKGSSYTIDTIHALKQPGVELSLIVSNETASQLHLWKEAKALLHAAPPLVGKRSSPISSTEIRDRLKKRLYCGHLVPAKALAYIQTHNLFV